MAQFVLTAQLQLQAPKNASKVVNQIQNQLKGVQIPVTVKSAAQATKQINQVTAATNKAASAAEAMGRSFGLAIKRYAAFTVASRAVSLFTNSLANAVDEAIDFQREVVKIAQVTGKTVKELQGLEKTITRLSVTLGASSKELLSTARILSQAGIKAGDLNVAIEALAKTTLAPTFEDITKTAEGAVAIIAQFEGGVGKLEKQLGSINAVAGQFAVESGDLIGAVRRFGGVFKSAGGNLEELLALFTSVRATTRESSESIATGLRTIFTRIQRPKTIEFLRQFGVELLDVEGKFVGPFEATKRLSEALSGLGQGDITFVRIAEELGGFRQIGKVIPLLQQFEVAERARQAALEGGDSLTRDAAAAQQALAVQITKVKEEFLALVRSIAETGSFQLFARSALEIASNLIKVADAIKPLIPLISTLAAVKFAKGLGSFAASAGSAFKGLGKNQGGVIQQFARGGLVPGSGNRDTVPAMLTPGEFVIRKSSVNKIGAGTLQAMNSNKFAKGGTVKVTNPDQYAAFVLDANSGSDLATRPVSLSATANKAIERADRNLPQIKPLNKDEYEQVTGKSSTFRKHTDPSVKAEFSKQYPKISTPSATQLKIFAGDPSFKQDSDIGTAKSYKMVGPFPVFGIGSPSSVQSDMQEEFSKAATTAIKTGAEQISPFLESQLNIAGPLNFNNDQFRLEDVLEGARATIEGYLLEAVVGAVSGAKVGAGTASGTGIRADFDLPGPITPEQKAKMVSLFDPNDDLTKISKGDVKRQRSTAASGDGALVNKIAKDLNKDDFSIIAALGGAVPKYAKGGAAPSDTVPALLTPGEFVINKKAAQSIGASNLNRMNKQGVVGFAKGGAVGGIQKFNQGGGITAKEFKKELAAGGNAALGQDIAALSTDISGIRKSLQEAKETTEYWSDEGRQLAKKSQDLSDAIYKLEQTAKPGAKGQKSLNKIYAKLEQVENQRIAAEQKAISSLKNQADMEDRLAAKVSEREKKIDQARSNKQKAKDSLTTGTQTTFKDSGMNKTANIAADKKAADAANRKAAADSKGAMSVEKLALVTGSVMTALSFLRPTIDENSGAIAKGFAYAVDAATSLVAGITTVIAALAAFGVQLNTETAMSALRGAGSFLKGEGVDRLKTVGRGVGRSMMSRGVGMQSAGRAAGGIKGGMQARLGKGMMGLGKGLKGLGPKLFQFSKFLGPLVGALAAAVGAVKLFTGIFDYFTGVHKNAAEAIEKGNVARSGELAVDAQIQKDFNNLAMASAAAGATIGAAFGPVGALIGGAAGAVVGGFIKIVGQLGPVQDAMKMFRNEFLVLLGGDSTKTIAAQATLQASVNKLKLEEAKNTEKATQAMKDVEAGSRTLASAFASGDLTGNLKNELGVLSATVALEASKMGDLEKMYQGGVEGAIAGGLIGSIGGVGGASVGAAAGASGVGGIFKEMGAILGLTTSAEEDRKKSREEVAKAQAEFTKKFKENGELFGRVAKNIIAADPSQSLEQVRANMLAQNETLQKATQGMGSEERSKFLDQIIENQKRAYDKQLKLIEAMNFGMQKFADRLKGTVSLMQNDATLDQSGGTSFDRSAEVLNVALSSAANIISDNELESAVGVLKKSMRDAGASTEEIEKTVKRFKSLNEFNKRLDENSPAFKDFQAKLKESVLSPKGGTTPENIVKEFGEKMTEGMSDEGKKQIMNALEGMDLEGENLQKIMAGDLSPILEAVGGASEEFKKQIVDGIVKQRGAAEKALIASIKSRKTSEDEFVAAQRKAIDTQLEAAKVFEDFGGKALSGEQKLGARIAQFNAGAAFSGTGGLSTGSASDIRRVAGQIGGNFNTLQSQATLGVSQGSAAFNDRAGAESDNRERLKKQNEALLQFTKQRITLLKEELAIVQKKNAAEKSALDKLISGDVEGFLDQQAAAGAGAALASGSAGLAGLFSASALGAGFKTLQGQGLSDQQLRDAEDLTLQRFGIQGTGVLSGTTAEEEALKAEGRELAGVMGELAQQSAQFEKAEISAKEAIINVQQARLNNISAAADQAQEMARGGAVYASRGMFIPRGTDTVPAMLTPGEFVVNRAAVNRGNNLQILRAMNTGGGASAPGALSGGGNVRYYNNGGFVDGLANVFTNALPGLTNIFSGFAETVEKLVNTKFNVALDPTNINVNFNGASFLETLKDDIKDGLLTEVGNEIQKYKANNSGDLVKKDSVL